jgi:hypothetical protein
MRVPTFRWWWAVALAGLSVLPLLLAQARFGPRRGLQFRDVQELKTWAEDRGLHCRSDWKAGRVTYSLAVSVHPLTWEQVVRLQALPRQGPHWEGHLGVQPPLRPGGTALERRVSRLGRNSRERGSAPARPPRGRRAVGQAGGRPTSETT